MGKLNGRVIVVTGGSGLIGNAIVEQIHAEGGVAINAEIAVETDLARGSVACDVCDPKTIEEAIGNILATHGKIDGWVNSAYPRTADWGNKFENISAESW